MQIKENTLPLFIANGVYIFPGFSNQLTIGKKKSLTTVNEAINKYNYQLLLVTKKTSSDSHDNTSSFFSAGVLCRIKIDKKLDQSILITFESQHRVRVLKHFEKDGVLYGSFAPLIDQPLTESQKMELGKLITKILKETNPKSPDFKIETFLKGETISDFFNLVLQHYPENTDNFKQRCLEIDNLFDRYQLVSRYIKFEPLKTLDLSKLVDRTINRRVKNRLSNQQREFYLREKLRAIREELGETDPRIGEVNRYFKRLEKECFPKHVKKRLEEELERYQALPPISGEAGLIKGYIDWIIDLPWCRESVDKTNLQNAKRILDSDHFGLKKPKERIIEYLAANAFSHKKTGQIICLVGPPGTGKTSLGRSIARAMNKNYVRISLGGVKDEAEIRGHRRTYLGSMPGKIIQAMKKAQTVNPVLVIDEIDKLSSDFRGDPASAMLEVLDPEQNKAFVDHYIEETYDLSKVTFIATANYEFAIPAPLYDRMEIINLSSYTEIEKIKIAKKHLLPKILADLNLKEEQVQFSDTAFKEIVKFYTRESGVRELKRLITKICQKIIVKILNNKSFSAEITEKNVAKFLGKRIFEFTEKSKKSEIGLVTGLAYTQFGGDILPIETTMFKGSGNLILTGKLGSVMKESANIAYDYIKSNAKAFKINFAQFLNNDFHIHVPEGAIPKDGPSAGVTITTALISLLNRHKVSNDIAMTGEITLRGKVLPIGGLIEKAISATRSGIKTIFIPKGNDKDAKELPLEVRKTLKIILVKKYEDIYKEIFDK